MIDEIYKRKFFENMSIDDVKTLGWSSIKSQEYRFKILLEIGVSTDDTILDVGCGYGDLSKNVKNYVGIDIRKLAIDIASKRYCDKKFFNCDIFEINDNYDWIIASGIFCFNSYDWYEYTKKQLIKCTICVIKVYQLIFYQIYHQMLEITK